MNPGCIRMSGALVQLCIPGLARHLQRVVYSFDVAKFSLYAAELMERVER